MITLVIFVVTYVALALGRVPGLSVGRPGIACSGAALLLLTGQISPRQAFAAQDATTLLILLAMMLVSVGVERAGLYERLAQQMGKIKQPRALLLGVTVATAVLSALLTNDVICVAVTPLVITAVARAKLPALPFLLAVACASNIGSALTPIGNPQNILIARHFSLSVLPFVLACAIPTVLSLAVLYGLLRGQVTGSKSQRVQEDAQGIQKTPRAWWREIDWGLLALFVGLFTVNGALQSSGWTESMRAAGEGAGINFEAPLTLISVTSLASNVISNVPAVMLLLSFVSNTARNGILLSLASTLAGNAIVMGSIANLIVVEQAKRRGISISFWQHARVGLPVTAFSLTMVVGYAYVAP